MKKVLSIFIDESGDTGKLEKNNEFYILSLVLHNQQKDIHNNIVDLNNKMKNNGTNSAFHCAPLIRKEDQYFNMKPKTRRKIFDIFFNFAMALPINYLTIVIEKKNTTSNELFIDNQIELFLNNYILNNLKKLSSYSKIVIYYDNGQTHITKTIKRVIKNWVGLSFEFRYSSNQEQYVLLQVADLVATMELLKQRTKLSHSERLIFDTKRLFKKKYYNLFIKKLLTDVKQLIK